MKTPIKTYPFDPAEYLERPEAQVELIADALGTGDRAYITHAIGVVARARGMTQIARAAGVTREALYRALSEEGDPRLSTLVGVLKALDVSLTVRPAPSATAGAEEAAHPKLARPRARKVA